MLDEIKNYIVAQGLETTNCCYKGAMPTTPDNVTVLYETAGFQPDMTFDDKGVEYPGLQIMCRGVDYATTRNKIQAIFKKLHGNTAASGIMNLIAQQSPVGLGQDDLKRWEFSVNFKVIKNM